MRTRGKVTPAHGWHVNAVCLEPWTTTVTNTALQPARLADARRLAAMSHEYVEAGTKPAWSASRITWHMRHPESIVLTARAATHRRLRDHALCRRCRASEPACRGSRASTPRYCPKFMTWLEETAFTAGTFIIGLELRATNQAAFAFYAALGYRELGRVSGLLPGHRAAIRMARDVRTGRDAEARNLKQPAPNRAAGAQGALVRHRRHLPDERILKAEVAQIAHPLRKQNPVEVIHFVLHDPRVEAFDGAIDRRAVLIEPLVAQAPVTRHQPTQARHRQTPFPPSSSSSPSGVARDSPAPCTGLARRADSEDSPAARRSQRETHADLRRRYTRAIQRAHRLVHVGNQRRQVRVESRHGKRDLPQQRRPHFQNRSYSHSIEPQESPTVLARFASQVSNWLANNCRSR